MSKFKRFVVPVTLVVMTSLVVALSLLDFLTGQYPFTIGFPLPFAWLARIAETIPPTYPLEIQRFLVIPLLFDLGFAALLVWGTVRFVDRWQRFQFRMSLRGVATGFGVLSAILAGIVWMAREEIAEKQLVAMLTHQKFRVFESNLRRRSGDSIAVLLTGRKGRASGVRIDGVYAEGRPHLSAFSAATAIDLLNVNLDDATLGSLGIPPQVTTLHLQSIKHSSIEDASWLAGIPPTVKSVVIEDSAVSAADIRELAQLPELHTLTIYFDDLSADAFAAIGECKMVVNLDVRSNSFTYDWLSSLSGRLNLRTLVVPGVPATGNQLEQFRGFPMLTSIVLSESKLAIADIKRIRLIAPNADIHAFVARVQPNR